MQENTSIDKLAIDGGKPVRTTPLPWELPGAHWIDREELELVSDVIKNKSPFRYYGLNPQGMVDQLESEFKSKLNRSYALGLGSGTAALNIAFCALGVGPGDEVLIPGYLWVSCISAIVRTGAIPRLVDIDDTFCMCPEDLKKKISDRSKAVLVVHMSGAPGRIDEIMDVCQQAGLPVVEDCAQCNGGSFNSKPVGTFGDIAIFSFQLNKNMTSGEGGMIVCDDANLYNRCFALHDLGYSRDRSGRLAPEDERYQLWGVGSRMSELTGAMALAQLRKLDMITDAMRTAKWKIRRQVENIEQIKFRNIIDPSGDSGPFLIMTFGNSQICGKFIEAAQAEGIKGHQGSMICLTMQQWGLHWYFNNLSLVNKRGLAGNDFPWDHQSNEFAKNYEYAKGTLPVCDDLSSRSGLLAIASCLTDDDIYDIVTAFKKVAKALF